MLGKLIKHEFRATGRLMAPLFGALLLLAVFVRVSDLILSAADAPVFFEALNALLLVVYVLAILGVTVFATILMIKRFHQNFLTDEGYLMFTLPTSVHSLLWSKLITAALFFIFTFLADALAVAIVVWRGGTARDLFESIVGLFRELNSFYMANGIALALEILAACSSPVCCSTRPCPSATALPITRACSPSCSTSSFRQFCRSSASQFSPAW